MGFFKKDIEQLKKYTKNPQALSSVEAKRMCFALGLTMLDTPSGGSKLEIKKFTKEDYAEEKEYNALKLKGRVVLLGFCSRGTQYTDADIINDIKELKSKALPTDPSKLTDNELSRYRDPGDSKSACDLSYKLVDEYAKIRDKKQAMSISPEMHMLAYSNIDDVEREKKYLDKTDSEINSFVKNQLGLCSYRTSTDKLFEDSRKFNRFFDLGPGSSDEIRSLSVSLDGVRKKRTSKKRKSQPKRKIRRR
jgi:hypothetical protein